MRHDLRYKSPLKIPEQRGPVFRYCLSAIIFALGAWMFYAVIDGVIHGRIMLPGRNTPAHSIARIDHPNLFWYAIAFDAIVAILLTYSSIAEILYTKHERNRISTGLPHGRRGRH
jgi:hypothetical protein